MEDTSMQIIPDRDVYHQLSQGDGHQQTSNHQQQYPNYPYHHNSYHLPHNLHQNQIYPHYQQQQQQYRAQQTHEQYLYPSNIQPPSFYHRPRPTEEKETVEVTRKDKVGSVSVQRQPRPQFQRYKKPPYPYIGMIALAIERSPEKMLALCEIRQALMDMFEMFRNDQYRGWKDSVRHNLTENKCFSRHYQCVVDKRRLAVWTVDLRLLPKHAFLLQNNEEARTGNWAPTLLKHFNLPPFVTNDSSTLPHLTNREEVPVKQTEKEPSYHGQPPRDDVRLTPISKLCYMSEVNRETDLVISATPTTGRTNTFKRKRTETDRQRKRQKSSDKASTFSPEHYQQVQDMISVSPEHVNVDVATGNLSNICKPRNQTNSSETFQQTRDDSENKQFVPASTNFLDNVNTTGRREFHPEDPMPLDFSLRHGQAPQQSTAANHPPEPSYPFHYGPTQNYSPWGMMHPALHFSSYAPYYQNSFYHYFSGLPYGSSGFENYDPSAHHLMSATGNRNVESQRHKPSPASFPDDVTKHAGTGSWDYPLSSTPLATIQQDMTTMQRLQYQYREQSSHDAESSSASGDTDDANRFYYEDDLPSLPSLSSETDSDVESDLDPMDNLLQPSSP